MNKLELSIHYSNAIVFSDFRGESTINKNMALIHEMMNLGFVPSSDFTTLLAKLDVIDAEAIYYSLIPLLKEKVGDHVQHVAMYPNFPEQVRNASDSELFLNAFVHYMTYGQWRPEYVEKIREIGIEPNVKYKTIELIVTEDLADKIAKVACSPDSITTFDKEAIKWALDNKLIEMTNALSQKITFAETRCIFLAEYLASGNAQSFGECMNNITDVLRVCTYLSDGDVSLAKNTKFKNFRRSERRLLTGILESFWDAETAVRHKSKWVKLLHSLHVGDYSDVMWENARKLRENEHIETFNGEVEAKILARDIKGAVKLLTRRPGDFARRLDHLLRASNGKKWVLNEFSKIAAEIPNKILIQLYGHFQHRTTERKSVVLPKGQLAKAVLIEQKGELSNDLIQDIIRILSATLAQNFYNSGDNDVLTLGKVWIDEALKACPVPSGMRSVSDGVITVPRGTRFNFGDDEVLRFFVYWKGRDIDLSATFHDENFKMIDHVSYTRLRSGGMKAYHSGDITNAPDGASEFIDINIDQAASRARYLAMNVFSYSGEHFNEIEECFVGWMGRNEPGSNDIYEPKTVKHCLNLINETRFVCPVFFDLHERKVIFVDMTKQAQGHYGGYNVESNKAGIEDILYAAANPAKMSLYDLFELHALVRSEGIVKNKEDADFTCGLEDCDFTPLNWAEIQTDWIG